LTLPEELANGGVTFETDCDFVGVPGIVTRAGARE
jgi:hypothetical protein